MFYPLPQKKTNIKICDKLKKESIMKDLEKFKRK